MAVRLFRLKFPKTGNKTVQAVNTVSSWQGRVFAASTVAVTYEVKDHVTKARLAQEAKLLGWSGVRKNTQIIPDGTYPSVVVLSGGRHEVIDLGDTVTLKYSATYQYPTRADIVVLARNKFRVLYVGDSLGANEESSMRPRGSAYSEEMRKKKFYDLIMKLRQTRSPMVYRIGAQSADYIEFMVSTAPKAGGYFVAHVRVDRKDEPRMLELLRRYKVKRSR